MTIRFTCAQCGSVLKIKDELAGTDGHCPKCKTAFVVPEPSSDEPLDKSGLLSGKSAKTAESAAEPSRSQKTSGKPRKGSSANEPFDPADFLMEEDSERPRRSAPSQAYDEESDDDDDAPPPKKAGGQKPAGTAGKSTASTPDSSVNASSHAKEMMLKAMEESRAHAGDMPVEDKPPGFDYSGMFREVIVKGGGALLIGGVLCYGMYLVFDRMMSSRLKIPPLGNVTGTITLDGKPLPGAMIYFAPLEPAIAGSKKERARTSYGIADENGNYKLIYIDSTEGAAIGKCRVWLDLVTAEKGQVIPPEYSAGTMMVREVKPGSQKIPIEMKSGQ
jgi:hypothetical protein